MIRLMRIFTCPGRTGHDWITNNPAQGSCLLPSSHLNSGRSVAMGKSVRSNDASWCSPRSEPRTDSLASPALSTN